MSARGRRFRLGLFVIGTGAMFVALLAFVLDSTIRSDEVLYYITFEENVKGMVIGSKVNFQGVPIGQVSDMRFKDGNTLVEMTVDPTRSTIQRVTRARIDRLLVTGQVTVELEGFDPESEPLPPGATIQAIEDPINALKGSIPELVDQATLTLVRLDGVLLAAEQVLGERNQERVETILDNLVATSAALREQTAPAVDALLAEGRAAVSDLRASLARLDAAVGDVRSATGEGQAALAEARAAIAALAKVEPRLAAMVDGADRFLREATSLATGLRAPALAALEKMQSTLEDVRALARQLELAPSSLLYGRTRPAAPFGGK